MPRTGPSYFKIHWTRSRLRGPAPSPSRPDQHDRGPCGNLTTGGGNITSAPAATSPSARSTPEEPARSARSPSHPPWKHLHQQRGNHSHSYRQLNDADLERPSPPPRPRAPPGQLQRGRRIAAAGRGQRGTGGRDGGRGRRGGSRGTDLGHCLPGCLDFHPGRGDDRLIRRIKRTCRSPIKRATRSTPTQIW